MGHRPKTQPAGSHEAASGTKTSPRALDGQWLASVDTPPKINLHDLEAIRREMARVYRLARGGQLETSEASRLVYMLVQLADLTEGANLERRLIALEHRQQSEQFGGDDD